MSKKGQLTPKQEAFIAHYFGAGNFNATRSAELAGYRSNGHTLESVASENLSKPEIRDRIQAEFRAKGMAADEVIGTLSDIARSTIDDIADIDENGFALNLIKARDRGKLHIIKSIETTKYGLKVTMHDKLDALDKLGRALKIFGDPVIDLRDLSDDQVLRLMERAAEKKRAQLQRNHELLSITDSETIEGDTE